MMNDSILKSPYMRLLAVVACLATVPFLGLPPAYESILYLVFHWIALATSWNILSGYSGYFSFGHGAFFGVGMYATAVLAGKLDWPFLVTLPFAAAFAALFATVLGAVAFRVKSVRGELFALLTLAATFVVATIVLNTKIDGGSGVYLNAVTVPVFAPTPSGTFYLMALAVAALTVLISLFVYRSRFGTGLFAIRDDEDVAEVLGVPTYRYKLMALALSSGLAGLVGGIHALFISYVTTGDTFGIALPLTVVLMAVFGGSRHWIGPAVGATAITALQYSFTSGDNAIAGKVITGLVLIVVILFMPEGIVGRLLRRLPGKGAGFTSPPSRVEAGLAVNAYAKAGIGGVLLQSRKLSKSFAGVHALRGVDVDVMQGEILGLLGPNGSGKSTFINVVSGHYISTGGSVTLEGREIGQLPAHRVARSGIARTYQIPRPFAELTVLQNVALPAMFGAGGLSRKQAELEAWEWLEFSGLSERAQALPSELNLHQRKFLEFARALASRPRLLMLDEVLSGLTPTEIDAALALIRRIRDRGTTIVFVEHVMRAVMALCDRIVVFNRGEVLGMGVPDEVMSRPEIVSAYLGKALDERSPKPPPPASSRTEDPAHA